MNYLIDFHDGTTYRRCIDTLMNAANGNHQYTPVEVTLKLGMKTVVLIINLAYRPKKNPKDSGLAGSLYVLGFKTAGSIFKFNDTEQDVKGAKDARFEGSYLGLGKSHVVVDISRSAIEKAFDTLAGNKTFFDPGYKNSLCTLIICSSEAIRFKDVKKGVGDVLNNRELTYPVNTTIFTEWKYAPLGL